MQPNKQANQQWRSRQETVSGAISNSKSECGKRPSVFKQPWPTERVQLLRAKHLGSLSQRAAGWNLTPLPPSLSPAHYDQQQMPTIPEQRSQSMLGRTKADLQPIGSTLLTACNLLMSLAGPHRAGVRANRRVRPPFLLWCRAAFSPQKEKSRSVMFPLLLPHLFAHRDTWRDSVTGNC